MRMLNSVSVISQVPGAMVTTADHDLHRKRRAPLAPYFSMQAIRRFDPVIRDKLEILSQRLEGYRRNGQIVDLDTAFTALTTDIVSDDPQSERHDQYPDMKADNAVRLRHKPRLPGGTGFWSRLATTLAECQRAESHSQADAVVCQRFAQDSTWVAFEDQTGDHRRDPVPSGMFFIQISLISTEWQFQGIRASLDGVLASRKEGAEQDKHATIFHGLLQSGLPESELKSARLTGEAQTVVAAGTLTTAHFLKSTTYHLLSNPPMLQSLNEELKQVMPDTATLPPFSDLEKLPYLNAVINEGLRISHGIIARLTRIAPDEDLHVAGYTITAGTPVSMSSWLVHLNPTLFPSPNEFRPQRWLEPGADGLKKYLCNFTRGSRVCLGKDLARTEMVYTLALMVRKWAGEQGTGMKLYETSRVDVDIAHDFFNPFPVLHSKGVRVVLE